MQTFPAVNNKGNSSVFFEVIKSILSTYSFFNLIQFNTG